MIQEIAGWVYKYLLFFLPQQTNGAGPSHPWDYAAHIIVSFTGTMAIFFLLKISGIHPKILFAISGFVMLVLGLMKEIDDKNLGRTDWGADMVANIAGIAAALIIIFLSVKFLN